MEEINFHVIKESDYRFLYELLTQRRQAANISHKKMPTYEEHVKFVRSRPYSKWYIINVNGEKAGSIYLTKQNEIGIHLFRIFEDSQRYQDIIKKINV